MAVAALSTSAPVLTTSPAPSPAPQPGAEAPKAFAKLVEQAKPDGKTAQDGTKAEAPADPDATTAADEAPVASSEADGDSKDAPADQSSDLLAELSAMIAAAGQLGVSQPTPVAANIVATTAPATSDTIKMAATTPSAAAIAVSTAAATLPDIAEPVSADIPAVPTDAAPASEGDATAATPAKAARTDIATLIASLKTTFQPTGGKDAPVVDATAPVSADIPATPSVTPSLAPTTAVATEAKPADPATAGAAAPIVAPVSAPKAAKPAAKAAPVATLDQVTPTTTPLPDAAPPPSDKQAATVDSNAQSTPDSATPAPTVAVADPAGSTLPAAQASSAPTTMPVAGPADTAPAGPSHAEQSVSRHLDLARDTQWLDQLASDISQAATQQGHLKFQLNPEHLGALTVEIANSASGTAIRMTADTDQARTIIADAQPRLLAEVRAQGLRVSESHVDLNQQGSGGSSTFAQGQQRQSSENHKPFAATQSVIRDDAGDSATRDDGELYA